MDKAGDVAPPAGSRVTLSSLALLLPPDERRNLDGLEAGAV